MPLVLRTYCEIKGTGKAMSYSLPLRVLDAQNRTIYTHGWKEQIGNVLCSSVPAVYFQAKMGDYSGRVPTVTKLAEHWKELSIVDLSPTGRVVWNARAVGTVSAIWRAYTEYSDVIAATDYTPQGLQPEKTISKVHQLLLDMYWESIDRSLVRNAQCSAHRGTPQLDLRDVLRIYNAPVMVWETADYFLRNPLAKVADLYIHLALNPRTAERRFEWIGIRAISIKRACALTSATQQVLWSDLPLGQIAKRCGYTDGSHMHREFVRATGGISPAVYRACTRQQH